VLPTQQGQPNQGVRPVTQGGRPVTGFARPATGSRPTTGQTVEGAFKARPAHSPPFHLNLTDCLLEVFRRSRHTRRILLPGLTLHSSRFPLNLIVCSSAPVYPCTLAASSSLAFHSFPFR